MTAAAVVQTLADRGVRLVAEGANLRVFGPLGDAERALLRQHKPALLELLAGDPVPIPAATSDPAPEPDRHCACGSPSWWRSPSSPTWCCAYCSPRDRSRVEAVESLTLASGQWAPGCAQPIPATVTTDDLIERHGEIVAGCRLVDVLAEADPDTDLPDLLDADALEGFARALVADHRVRPLPPTDLPPLARVAREIGDTPAGLLAWARSGGGLESRRRSAILDRLCHDPGACDRALLALRANPNAALGVVLARALENQTTRTTK